MNSLTRQFDFSLYGLQVFCTAILYPDGSLQRIEIDYVMEGMIDWLVYCTYTVSPAIRLMRMKFMKEAKRVAAEYAVSALSPAYDAYDFDSF